MLSDSKIMELMEQGEIIIKPFKRKNLGANSYDLTLSSKVRLVLKQDTIDMTKNIPETKEIDLPLTLFQGDSIIFQTNEIVGVQSTTVGMLSERSNFCRLPLRLNYSKLIDTGFVGTISAVLTNIAPFPVVIRPNYRIIQVMFFKVDGEIEKDYKQRDWSKNLNQFGESVPEYKVDKEWK